MAETTKERLITAASKLLDSGGQNAVTLRAVAELVGVSHNAPYRHFRDRSALLAAVAERDFIAFRHAFSAQNQDSPDSASALRNASAALIDYARKHQARYRLLFSDPGLSPDRSLREAAFGSFEAFSVIVSRCQKDRILPSIETVALTGLIYTALHGAIDLELGGRASGSKGLGSIETTVSLLFELLKPVDTSDA